MVASSLRMRGGMPSIPGDLSTRRLFSVLNTSSSIVKDDRGLVRRSFWWKMGMLLVSSFVNVLKYCLNFLFELSI